MPNSSDKSFGKTILKILWLCILVSLISGAVVFGYQTGIFGKKEIETITIDTNNSVEINVARGASTGGIAKTLEEKGVIKYPTLFKVLSNVDGYDGNYRAGTHVVSSNLNYEQIMRVLTGTPKNMPITIPEGYSFKQIEDILASRKLINRKNFKNLAETQDFDYSFLEKLPKTKYRLEGYLFPDTYYFDLKTPDIEILKTMLKNFEKKITPEHYQRAKELKMSMHEILTLASLVEKEATIPEERKTIAGLFYNRLKSNDQSLKYLQSDVTVQYLFVIENGKNKERLTLEDVKVKDPYNTYANKGLPPGPICMPGIASIEATLYPEKHDFFYFVAKGDSGEHYFSKTLEEHNNAVKEYGVK